MNFHEFPIRNSNFSIHSSEFPEDLQLSKQPSCPALAAPRAVLPQPPSDGLAETDASEPWRVT